MMRSILSGVPFVLLNLRAPDAAAGGGGGEAAPAQPEEVKPAAEAKPPVEVKPAAEAAAAEAKPTIFQRAAAALKSKSELLATISARDVTIAAHAKTIVDLRAELTAANKQLEGMAELEASLEALAGEKAIDLAAGQGVPALPTKPAVDSPEDEVKAAYEAASAEENPVKRGLMFARASRMLEAKAKQSKN